MSRPADTGRTGEVSGEDGSYTAYQRRIAREHLIPLLDRLGVRVREPVLDVGCGTGGFAIALAQAYGVEVHGIDVDLERIELARSEAARCAARATFRAADVTSDRLGTTGYELVLLRDVAEHLGDLRAALDNIRRHVAPTALLYVTYPPWRGPFAGHQHNARSVLRFLPYLHWVAPGLFLRLAHRLESGRDAWLEDQRQIVANRLGRRGFEEAARATGWELVYTRSYLVRPALIRFGLPTISNGPVGRIPIVGEMLTTGCEHLLRRTDALH